MILQLRILRNSYPQAISVGYRFYAHKQSVETDFDRKWRRMSVEERLAAERELDPLNKVDWRQLTLDQKRACKNIYIHLTVLLYPYV